MIAELPLAIAAVVSMCVAIASAPPMATCPRGWYVEGVRPSGRSRCLPAPPPNCGEPVPPNNGPCPLDSRETEVAVYCTGGSHPIVVNERTVGCTR